MQFRTQLALTSFITITTLTACGIVNRSVEPDLQSNASFGGEHVIISDASFDDGAGGGTVGQPVMAILNCHNAGIHFKGLVVKCTSNAFGSGVTPPTEITMYGKTNITAHFQQDPSGGYAAAAADVEVGDSLMLSLSGMTGLQAGAYEINVEISPLDQGHALTLHLPVKIDATPKPTSGKPRA